MTEPFQLTAVCLSWSVLSVGAATVEAPLLKPRKLEDGKPPLAPSTLTAAC